MSSESIHEKKMAAILGRVRSHIAGIYRTNRLPVSFKTRDGFQGVCKPLILTASSSNVAERIEKKRQEALVGGGLKRIDRQHKRVRNAVKIKSEVKK